MRIGVGHIARSLARIVVSIHLDILLLDACAIHGRYLIHAASEIVPEVTGFDLIEVIVADLLVHRVVRGVRRAVEPRVIAWTGRRALVIHGTAACAVFTQEDVGAAWGAREGVIMDGPGAAAQIHKYACLGAAVGILVDFPASRAMPDVRTETVAVRLVQFGLYAAVRNV